MPAYAQLRGVDRGVLRGLIEQHGTPAWQADHELGWQRAHRTWEAVETALAKAAKGRTAEPRSSSPRWLTSLVRWELERLSESSWGRGEFETVRLLERLGLVTPPHDATYVLAMISGLTQPDMSLREDRELLDDLLWRLFEVEGGGEVSLANIDRFRPRTAWRSAFLSLAADGTIDRDRVLTSCLAALQRDFNHYRAAWFSATWLALSPSPDEAACHQEQLRRLLRAGSPATVSFALRQLQTVHKAGRLEPAASLDALTTATLVKPKGTATAALRLAKALAGADADLRRQAAEVARSALGHEHPDVQHAAVALLSTYGEPLGDAAHLAPSVRAGLALPVERAPRTEVPEQRLVPPAAPTTGDDLVERTAALLEDCTDQPELEAVLAGLAVLDDPGQLRSLHKRARAVVGRSAREHFGEDWLRGAFARLLLSTVESAPAFVPVALPQQQLVVGRFAEVRDRLVGRRPRDPLLATPDLPGGFVSSAALEARLGAAHGAPGTFDAEASSLRSLSPQRDRPPVDRVLVGRMATHTYRYPGGHRHTERYYQWRLDPGSRKRPRDFDATWLPPTGRDDMFPAPYGDWVPALAAVWPHDAELFLAIAGTHVLRAAQYADGAPDVNAVLEALATHPGRLGTNAHVVLMAGLAATKGDQRLHAVDAFLELVPTGRLEARDLARTMGEHVEGHTVTRWAESLGRAAADPAGVDAVLDLLTDLLPRIPRDTPGLHALLDVLREESLRAARSVTDPQLRDHLAGFSGSSKAAKTARALLG